MDQYLHAELRYTGNLCQLGCREIYFPIFNFLGLDQNYSANPLGPSIPLDGALPEQSMTQNAEPLPGELYGSYPAESKIFVVCKQTDPGDLLRSSGFLDGAIPENSMVQEAESLPGEPCRKYISESSIL